MAKTKVRKTKKAKGKEKPAASPARKTSKKAAARRTAASSTGKRGAEPVREEVGAKPTLPVRGRQASVRSFLVHGHAHTGKWDFSHHVVPPISSSSTFRLESGQRGAAGDRLHVYRLHQ